MASPAGVVHWCGVPSLIHGVMPPWRWSVARFSEKQVLSLTSAPHVGFRTASMTVPLPSISTGTLVTGSSSTMLGPMPEPMSVVSVGRKRLPSAPVGSRLRKVIRTGRSLVATIVGPR